MARAAICSRRTTICLWKLYSFPKNGAILFAFLLNQAVRCNVLFASPLSSVCYVISRRVKFCNGFLLALMAVSAAVGKPRAGPICSGWGRANRFWISSVLWKQTGVVEGEADWAAVH